MQMITVQSHQKQAKGILAPELQATVFIQHLSHGVKNCEQSKDDAQASRPCNCLLGAAVPTPPPPNTTNIHASGDGVRRTRFGLHIFGEKAEKKSHHHHHQKSKLVVFDVLGFGAPLESNTMIIDDSSSEPKLGPLSPWEVVCVPSTGAKLQ
jgi:hypothetical protein